MEVEFDPIKSEKTRAERGFGFDFAARVFLGRTVVSDAREVAGEVRLKAIGEIDGIGYVVIFTDRGEVRRIISARRANRKERGEWQSSD